MRDPDRIDGVLETVRSLWEPDPDLRLGQLVVIAANLAGRQVICPEIFSLEDDELVAGLDAYRLRRES